MSEFWRTTDDTEPLSAEVLRRTFRQIEEAPPHPCTYGHHVVSALALERDGGYPCGNCAAIVWVENGRRVS